MMQMKAKRSAQRILLPAVSAIALTVLARPAAAVDLKTGDGAWTFSLNGEVNVDYIFSNCQSASTAVSVDGGLACVGTETGSSVSNIGNGLLPAAFTFGVATTQDGIDLAAHLGLYPGIVTNDGGSPNKQATASNGSSNTALGTTGLDIRQVFLTFGNKHMGTFTLGRNIGLFGADVILADMTLPGVGAPGSAAGPAPANTTLGGIGLGYIYTDWLAQIDYTTPDFSGFNLTVGAFDPLNSLTEPSVTTTNGFGVSTTTDSQTQPKKAPGFHAKGTFTLPISEGSKLYLSVAYLTQQQRYVSAYTGNPYSYTGNGVDVFGKLDLHGFEAVAYYYHATGLGTTELFNLGAFTDATIAGATRPSYGYLGQITYKIGPVKLGYNHGDSRLNFANAADQAANPYLVRSNRKDTVGVYYSLTKNLMLLAEGSYVKDVSAAGSNTGTTVTVGGYLGF